MTPAKSLYPYCLAAAVAACSSPENLPEAALAHRHQEIVTDDAINGDTLPPYTIALTYDDGPNPSVSVPLCSLSSAQPVFLPTRSN